jgi:hypothetical protein
MNKAVELVKMLRGPGVNIGLLVVTVTTTDPDPCTFTFQGSKIAVDIDLFEIPISIYPLCKGDRLLAFPIIGSKDQRWGVIQKINQGLIIGTMTGATSLQVAGIGREYNADDLIIPPYFSVANEYSHYVDQDSQCTGGTSPSLPVAPVNSDDYLKKDGIKPLADGDKVSLAPTWDSGGKKIKYVILERYV